MKAYKDSKTGKWKIQYCYTDWQGNIKKSTKRGFKTKREAEEWVRTFLVQKQGDFHMNFGEFIQVYYDDVGSRLREHTMINKKYLIELKILPYFKNMKIADIKAAHIRKWQNELIVQGYADTYLKSINNQLSAIMNHAVRFYELKSNQCKKAGSMGGKSNAEEMLFWTKDEFNIFIEAIMDKQRSYMAFMTLYWTGMRIGELLALTVADIDTSKKTISVTKSYQRLNKKRCSH